MSRCRRCMGFWADDGLEARCLNCGHREAVNESTDVTVERVMEERMSRPIGSKNKPKVAPVKGKSHLSLEDYQAELGQVLDLKKGWTTVDECRQQMGLKDDQDAAMPPPINSSDPFNPEHPIMQVLAEEWEALDAQMVNLKERQEFLQGLVQKCRERLGASTLEEKS